MNTKQPTVIVPGFGVKRLRKARVIVARPSLEACGKVVKDNAVLNGSLPIDTADIRRGDRFGFLTVSRVEFGSLGHVWRQGSWDCDCTEATCFAWHGAGGTDTRCGEQCECRRMGWKISLACDCGKADYWTFEKDVLRDTDLPGLTCSRSGGIARHVGNALRSDTSGVSGGVHNA